MGKRERASCEGKTANLQAHTHCISVALWACRSAEAELQLYCYVAHGKTDDLQAHTTLSQRRVVGLQISWGGATAELNCMHVALDTLTLGAQRHQ